MKLSIIFVLTILIVGHEAWAKDQPGDLSKSSAPTLSPSDLDKWVLERAQMIRLVSDVANDRAAVKPSMVPPEIFDRIYRTEKYTQEFLIDVGKMAGTRVYTVEEMKQFFYLGQTAAMRDLLYIAGVLPESVYSLNLLFNNKATETDARIEPVMVADRMRLITAMLLLLNYKESNPVPPGDMVQVTAVK